MRVKFFMAMNPPTATHQEKQVRVVKGRAVFYEPPELKDARAKLTAHLSRHKPEKRLEGPVQLVVKWCFPRGAHPDGAWRTTKPDTDNLNKLLKDCMTAVGFWKDDAQVVSEVIQKFWSEVPGIYVCAEELEPGKCSDCRWYRPHSAICFNERSKYSGSSRTLKRGCEHWEKGVNVCCETCRWYDWTETDGGVCCCGEVKWSGDEREPDECCDCWKRRE